MNGSVLAPAAAAAPTGVVASPRVPLGVITVAGRAWRYPFTPEDVLWTARFIVGEAGGRDNRENRAVIWAMLNRYALFTYRVHRSFQAFIRAYSTTLQPVLNSKGAARRHMHSASFVHTGGEYPEQARPRGRVPRGQLRRHLVLQRTAWSALPLQARQLALQALSGQSANPGIGNASEFAETGVYYHDRYQRRPSYDEWVRFSQDFPRSAGKAWTWIGPVAGLTQYRNNTFYLDNRARHLPAGAVRVVPPAATAEEAELAPTGTAQTPVNHGSQAYVRWVQGALNQILGLRLATDGLAGAQTSSAIRSFQQRQGLAADGVVGPKTEAALRAALQSRPLRTPPSQPGLQRVILDDFDFNRDDLKPAHRQQVAAVAQRIVRGQRGTQAIRVVRVVGHTDPVGTDSYNIALGRRRAKRVARELRAMVARLKPSIAGRISFVAESRGEREPISNNPTRNRRVEITVAASQIQPGRTIPPDTSGCGVPATQPQREAYFDEVLSEVETRARRTRVQPTLCLFQNADERSDRNHFQFQAQRWARRIAAVADPDPTNCNTRVGPTSYDTGANIISTIEAAHVCLGRKPIKAVHIFSHSGSHGVFGPHGLTQGLYRDEPDAASRSGGARRVTDISTAVLAQDVVIVLHGCNTANGDDSFARALFDHLAATLTNPKVFGHTTLGCAGRDSNWREFSRRAPAGQRVNSIAPHYFGKGGCS